MGLIFNHPALAHTLILHGLSLQESERQTRETIQRKREICHKRDVKQKAKHESHGRKERQRDCKSYHSNKLLSL